MRKAAVELTEAAAGRCVLLHPANRVALAHPDTMLTQLSAGRIKELLNKRHKVGPGPW